jgi:hypothetical protein
LLFLPVPQFLFSEYKFSCPRSLSRLSIVLCAGGESPLSLEGLSWQAC